MTEPKSATLTIDAATLSDLEVFQAADGEPSLFEFCNHTRYDGGARVLKQRMKTPSADAEVIQGIQRSVQFINDHREVFKKMPSAYAANRVDHYTHEVLPVVLKQHWLEFGIESLSLWLNHDRHYSAIMLGVQVTCRYIRLLREFVGLSELDEAGGEVSLYIHEIRELLNQPNVLAVPDSEESILPWRIIRLDQIFRVFEKSTLARLQELLHEIDALVSLADVSRQHHFVLPEILQDEVRIEAEGLGHPFVVSVVTNPVSLNQRKRLLFLTGPNMAGKTTYLRAVATALYMAHLGMGVPAQQFRFTPVDCLFSCMSLTDDLRGGVSYFRAEALRVKAIATAVAEGKKVVALMDEPFKGTNVKDALDASSVVLPMFAGRKGCLFMFSSHLIELAEQFAQAEFIDCRYFEADVTDGKLAFDYQLREGVSEQRLGMRVLEEEGVFDLLRQTE